MRSGGQSLTHFLWFAVPAVLIAAAYTSWAGGIIALVIVIFIVTKFCNTLDRADIKASSKHKKGSHRR